MKYLSLKMNHKTYHVLKLTFMFVMGIIVAASIKISKDPTAADLRQINAYVDSQTMTAPQVAPAASKPRPTRVYGYSHDPETIDLMATTIAEMTRHSDYYEIRDALASGSL